MTNFHKGPAWLERVGKKDFSPGGVVYEAMVLAKGTTTVEKAKKQQNPSLDVEGLPWPLSVPWSGSFLLSSKPSRDYIAHGVFADMEVMIVSMYRRKMIESSADISELRDEMVGLLRKFYDDFRFADGIETYFEDEDLAP